MESNLTEFNTGGTHEENPLGGIQQGTGPEGVPNFVEEGETKFTMSGKDYIFSDRISTKSGYVTKYSLPKYIKDKSFAEASKAIEKAFDEKTDNASLSTKEAFFTRLVAAQERAKLEKAAHDVDLTVEQYEDFLSAQNAQEELEAATLEDGPTNEFSIGGAIAQGGSSMFGAASSDLTSDKEVRDKMSVGGTAAKYGLMGAAAGSVVPGFGTAIGAGVGAAAGATIAATSNAKIAGEQQDFDFKNIGKKNLEEGMFSAFGGPLPGTRDPRPRATGIETNPAGIDFDFTQTLYAPSAGLDLGFDTGFEETVNPSTDFPTYGSETGAQDGGQDSNLAGIAGLAGSAAPFIGNLIEGASLERDDPIKYNRVGRTYKPEFADEQRGLNIVDDSFSGLSDQLASASAGEVGSYRANLLGANVNKARARSEAYNRVNDINRQEEKFLNEDFANAARENVAFSNRELIEKRQDDAAYESARAAYRNSAYEGLGEMGKTLFQSSQYDGISPYNIFGKRLKDA